MGLGKIRLRWAALVIVCLMSAATTVHAAYDFVQNSEFQQGLTHWTVNQGDKDAALTVENGEVRFQCLLGSVRHSIQQSLELNVSEYTSLILHATVRVDEAKLAGTGLNGLEAPLSVFVLYTDAAGTEHLRPVAGSDGRFWRGFYYEEPAPPAISASGYKIERGTWQDYQLDLMTLVPRPQRIHAIGAEGSGWARRSAAIKRLSLIAPEEGREFAVNPALTRMAAGWQPCVDFEPAAYQAELVPLPQGMQIQSALGDKRVGLLQKIEADVSSFQSLLFTAEVKVDKQRLGGTGWNGREAPLALFVTYTDVNGVKHDRLPLKADDVERRMFWRGLYTLKPQPPASDMNGIALEAGVWSTVSFELMELDPKPRIIHSFGVEGSGRAPRDASVRKVSLKGR
jgi:hypothetical protein